MKTHSFKSIIGGIAALSIPLIIGSLAAFLTRNEMAIYGEIIIPKFSPPSVLFPIVWTILYIMMGISSWIIWRKRHQALRVAMMGLWCYGISLILNFAWCLIFFNARQFGVAFIELLVLWGSIALTIKTYFKLSPQAAWLQFPYLAWVSFAGYLNLAIWWLNR